MKQANLRVHLHNNIMDQAEHFFLQGLTIAREQSAKSFELRVCLSLEELYEQQGARERHSGFDRVYRSFTEGFGTADLVRAKARLETLARSPLNCAPAAALPASPCIQARALAEVHSAYAHFDGISDAIAHQDDAPRVI
jgi:hypothetical protein